MVTPIGYLADANTYDFTVSREATFLQEGVTKSPAAATIMQITFFIRVLFC